MQSVNMQSTQEYQHKKFNKSCSKRKREDDIQPQEPTTTKPFLSSDTIISTETLSLAKRRQTKALFRPWLLDDKKTQQQQQSNLNSKAPSTIVKYHPTMIRNQHQKERSPKAQLRRDRNTVACMKIRHAEKLEAITIEQEYLQLRVNDDAATEASIRAKLYLEEIMRRQALANASKVIGFPTTQPALVLTQQHPQHQRQLFLLPGSTPERPLFVFGSISQ